MMHLSGEMAESFFDMVKEPSLAAELEGRGYMLNSGAGSRV
jgi:hypothetical protein